MRLLETTTRYASILRSEKVSDKLFKLYLIVIPLDSDVQDTTVICIWNVSQSVINSSFVMPLPLG